MPSTFVIGYNVTGGWKGVKNAKKNKQKNIPSRFWVVSCLQKASHY